MSDQNKEIQSKPEAAQSTEAAPAVNPSSSWKRLMSKKWAFPALYMVAAAIILTLMWVYQSSGTTTLTGKELGLETGKAGTTVTDANGKTGDSVEVAASTETMRWPVNDRNEQPVVMPFFDKDAPNDVKQAAMIEYGDTLIPNAGVDLARQDNEAFDVLAAASGKVTNVQDHPVAGQTVEITHPNGLVTVYQSLSDVKVAKDADVKKGDLIAKAGRSELGKDLGVHLHFEVRQGQNGTALNPETAISDK